MFNKNPVHWKEQKLTYTHTTNLPFQKNIFLRKHPITKVIKFDELIKMLFTNNFSYLMGRRCLFTISWPSFYWWCHNKNTLWGRCFITWTSLAPYLFFLSGWLKPSLTLLLDQLRLVFREIKVRGSFDLCWCLSFFWLSQTWPVTLQIQG